MPEAAEPPRLDLATVCRLLSAEGVRFVVIGGVAATLRGAALVTYDMDLVPDLAPSNLARLSHVLLELKAQVRFVGPVINTGDGDWLMAAKTWNFETTAGQVDVLLVAEGGGDFEALAQRANIAEIEPGVTVMVASLDDLISMKEAAGRPKDLSALPMLRWLRDREQRSP